MLATVTGTPMQGHPMIPLLQVSAERTLQQGYDQDIDLFLEGNPLSWSEQILQRIIDVASRHYTPKLFAQGNSDFQFTRGLLGVSL
jgi:hypothetical protein